MEIDKKRKIRRLHWFHLHLSPTTLLFVSPVFNVTCWSQTVLFWQSGLKTLIYTATENHLRLAKDQFRVKRKESEKERVHSLEL